MAYLVIREQSGERIVPLTEAEVTLGRSKRNQIRLQTEQCSRRHLKIVRTVGGHHLVDNNSTNGTYINGRRIAEKRLVDGDTITAGEATILFRQGEIPKAGAAVEPPCAPLPIQDRNVQILLRSVASAASAQDLESFLVEALDGVIEIVQAGRGVIFTREDSAELTPRAARDRERRALGDLAGVSRAIPDQVWATQEPVALLDPQGGEESIRSRSVSTDRRRAVMCAPLRAGDRPLGVLYVDSPGASREYGATDLALFEGVANTLALTLENIRAGQEARNRRTV